jgi:hypothetical protein
MLQSTYNKATDLDPTEKLKKKLEKNQFVKPDVVQEENPIPEPIKPNEQKVTGGSYTIPEYDKKQIAPLNDETLDPEEMSTGQKVGAGALAAAPGILDMASSAMMNKEPMNAKERKANTISMGMKGMSTGSAVGTAVGGPYGAAIGAGVGLVAGVATGLLQGKGDQEKLDNEAKLEKINYLADVKDKRKKAQMLSDGKLLSQKNQDILSSQMGMLGSKYSQNS